MARLEAAIETIELPTHIYVGGHVMGHVRRIDALGERRLPHGPWSPWHRHGRKRYRRGREKVRPRMRGKR